MNDANKITIGFRFKDVNGGEYTQESTVEVFFDLGEDELCVIGRQLNSFLAQAGYFRTNHNIFMKDLTEEECDAVAVFLDEYRRNVHEK